MSLADLEHAETSRSAYLLKQSANIYTVMLMLALLFVMIGCLFLFLEMKAYDLSVRVPTDAKAPQTQWTPVERTVIAESQRSVDLPLHAV